MKSENKFPSEHPWPQAGEAPNPFHRVSWQATGNSSYHRKFDPEDGPRAKFGCATVRDTWTLSTSASAISCFAFQTHPCWGRQARQEGL